MPGLVEIIIHTIDESTNQNGGITKSFTELNSAINVGKEALAAIEGAYNSTVGAALTYAETVRQVALASGTDTEQASRLIGVTKILGVETGTLEMAMKFMARDGVQPSIEGLAALSDQYLKLAPGVDRDNFLLKEFGRSGMDMAVVMSQGSDKLKELNSQINQQLILTPQQVAAAIKLKESQAELSQQWEAQKVVIGNDLVPALTLLVQNMNEVSQQEMIAKELGFSWQEMTGEQRRQIEAIIEAMHSQSDALDQVDRSTSAANDSGNAYSDTLKQQATDARALVDQTKSLQDETDNYRQTESDLISKKMDIIKSYEAGKISLATEQKQLGENDAALQKNEDAHTKWAKDTLFSLLQTQIAAKIALDPAAAGSLTDFMIKAGEQMGEFDPVTADAMKSVNDSLNTLDTSNPDSALATLKQALDALRNDAAIPVTITTTVVTNGAVPTSAQSAVGAGSTTNRATHASGFEGVVPPGYAGDSYPVSLTSGEHVKITPLGHGDESSGMNVTISNSTIIWPSDGASMDAIKKAINYVG